jgi:hypothetical protein
VEVGDGVVVAVAAGVAVGAASGVGVATGVERTDGVASGRGGAPPWQDTMATPATTTPHRFRVFMRAPRLKTTPKGYTNRRAY